MGPNDPIFAKRPTFPAPARAGGPTIVHAQAGQMFSGLKDPALLEFIRGGTGVSAKAALQTACVFRCVDLLSSAQAMLPFRIMEAATKKEAKTHWLYELVRWQPNPTHTAFEFVKLMEVRRFLRGNAYAIIIRGYQGRPVALQPIDPDLVETKQNEDWSMSYRVRRPDGRMVDVPAKDMFHLRDLSVDGIVGEARTKLAARAIEVAKAAEIAQASIFEKGMITGGALEHPETLGEEAYKRLQNSMQDRYAGAENAGQWIILEEGLKASRFTMTGQEAQTVEARNHQIEDIARAFGVPRPLLMMDDTSWGSGIEQLAILFVRFGLNPGMVAWEQAARRCLLDPKERGKYYFDFDEQELLRGTMKDQGEFFARALGSGGSKPWLEPNEVREVTGFTAHDEGSGLKPIQQAKGSGDAQADEDQTAAKP